MFGDKLRFFRKKARLSQKQLAEKIGFPQTTISDWELNKYEPGFTVVVKITTILKIKLTDFNKCINNLPENSFEEKNNRSK